MKISAKAEYACVAMMELALRHQRKLPVSIKAIAESYAISSAFLMQILLQLKGAGLVTSVRGAAGGYHLARAVDKITLAEIIHIIDGPTTGASALSALPPSPLVQTLLGIWHNLQADEEKQLAQFTLAEMLKKIDTADVMNYQI